MINRLICLLKGHKYKIVLRRPLIPNFNGGKHYRNSCICSQCGKYKEEEI